MESGVSNCPGMTEMFCSLWVMVMRVNTVVKTEQTEL